MTSALSTDTAASTVETGLVDVVDRSEHRRHIVDRDPGRDAAPGEPDPVPDEQEPVAARHIVEVEGAGGVVGAPSDGPHQAGPGGAPRVPVSSWATPSVNTRWVASPNPARRSCTTISSDGGR